MVDGELYGIYAVTGINGLTLERQTYRRSKKCNTVKKGDGHTVAMKKDYCLACKDNISC